MYSIKQKLNTKSVVLIIYRLSLKCKFLFQLIYKQSIPFKTLCLYIIQFYIKELSHDF